MGKKIPVFLETAERKMLNIKAKSEIYCIIACDNHFIHFFFLQKGLKLYQNTPLLDFQ